jgi:hypothetical protein
MANRNAKKDYSYKENNQDELAANISILDILTVVFLGSPPTCKTDDNPVQTSSTRPTDKVLNNPQRSRG